VKKLWVLILLISLGLNLGLGVRLLSDRGEMPNGTVKKGCEVNSTLDCAPAGKESTSRAQLAERRLERLASHLGLTPEQKKIFAQTRAEVGSGMMIRRGEMLSAKTDLLDLVVDESTPPEMLRRSFRELVNRQAEIDSVITEVLLRELEILNPDQRVQYLKMLPMGHRGPAGMRGRGRGHR